MSACFSCLVTFLLLTTNIIQPCSRGLAVLLQLPRQQSQLTKVEPAHTTNHTMAWISPRQQQHRRPDWLDTKGVKFGIGDPHLPSLSPIVWSLVRGPAHPGPIRSSRVRNRPIRLLGIRTRGSGAASHVPARVNNPVRWGAGSVTVVGSFFRPCSVWLKVVRPPRRVWLTHFLRVEPGIAKVAKKER